MKGTIILVMFCVCLFLGSMMLSTYIALPKTVSGVVSNVEYEKSYFPPYNYTTVTFVSGDTVTLMYHIPISLGNHSFTYKYSLDFPAMGNKLIGEIK